MERSERDSGVTLAELLAAFSLATALLHWAVVKIL